MNEYPTCPKCGSHEFRIPVTQTAVVLFYHDGDHAITDQPHGDMEWDDKTLVQCDDCDHEAAAGRDGGGVMGFRFYAEMPSARGSKSASKHWPAFDRAYLWFLATCDVPQYNNVIAVILSSDGQPLWCGEKGDQMDAFCPVNDRSNAPVELGCPSREYLRKRCVRIPIELARKLHPNLFKRLEI